MISTELSALHKNSFLQMFTHCRITSSSLTSLRIWQPEMSIVLGLEILLLILESVWVTESLLHHLKPFYCPVCHRVLCEVVWGHHVHLLYQPLRAETFPNQVVVYVSWVWANRSCSNHCRLHCAEVFHCSIMMFYPECLSVGGLVKIKPLLWVSRPWEVSTVQLWPLLFYTQT